MFSHPYEEKSRAHQDWSFTGYDSLCQAAPMQDQLSKHLGDINQLAKLIVGVATDQCIHPTFPAEDKDATAVALGRRGDLRGGSARARMLTPEKRLDIARLAAAARWNRDDR